MRRERRALGRGGSGGQVLRAALAGYRRHRFGWLFFSLLLTIGVRPAIEALAPGFDAIEWMLALNLLLAIGSVPRRYGLQVLVVLGLAFAATRAVQSVLGLPALLPVSQGLWVAAAVLALVATMRRAIGRGRVDSEHIFAALDVYLLAGLIFGVGFWVLDHVAPGSFAQELTLPRAIYFSFVTLATLGYGDIVPVRDPAQGLAVLEAVGGQMYLVVLVARLVTLYSSRAEE